MSNVLPIGKKRPRLLNPLSGKKLTKEGSDYVYDARQARNGARRDLRSGNPAKRAAALPIYMAAPKVIAALYRQEAVR